GRHGEDRPHDQRANFAGPELTTYDVQTPAPQVVGIGVVVRLVAGGLSKQVLDRALAFDEGGDHLRVEVGGRALENLGLGVLEGAGGTVRSIGSHSVQGIGDCQDAGTQRNLIGAQLVRITVAVPAL